MDGKMKKKRGAPTKPKQSPKKAKKSKKDDPNKIKRPLSAYLYFTKDFREERAAKGLDNSKVNEVAKLAGERWKSMSDDDKKPYNEKARIDKERYHNETGKNVVKQDSDKPKRNPTAYFLFLADFRKKMANEKLPEGQKVPTLAGEKWRKMTDKDKEPYLKEEAKQKAKYEEAMKEYRKKVPQDAPKPKPKSKPKKKPEPEEDDDDEEEEEEEEEEEDESEEEYDDDDDDE